MIKPSHRSAVEAVAPIIEQHEGRKPEREIAELVVAAATDQRLGNNRLVCVADVLAFLRGEGADVVDYAMSVKIEREFGRLER
jgi:hypothetical protein